MVDKIVGRLEEKLILKKISESSEPEFVAIHGRRRVEKTFLVKQFFDQKFTFKTQSKTTFS